MNLSSSSDEEDVGETSSPSFQKQELLYMFLGLNAKFRTPPGAWDFLSIRDLMSCSSLSKDIRRQLLESVEYTRCRDGKDYLVPFPGFPGLLSTPDDLKVGAGLFPHQLASLQAMHRMENASAAFGSLRGGILGDAPGLGKTITMLALIASTAGRRPVPPPEFWDAAGVNEGWKHMRVNPMALQEVLTALKPIRTWVQGYIRPTSPYYKKFQEVTRFVSPPYTDDRFPTIRDMELHVYRELRNFVPRAELELFRSNVIEIKAGMDKGNRKLLKGNMGRRLLQERRLIPSSATLIVVPDALLEHWFQQIHNHLHLNLFSDHNVPGLQNIVYVDGIGDFVNARLPLRQASVGQDVLPAYLLSQYFIVITTFSRCEAEFEKLVRWGQARKGQTTSNTSTRNSQSTSRKRRRRSSSQQQQSLNDPFKSDEATKNASSFHKIRWLRIVVDEGHELGTHEAATNVTRFIHEIAAERRWVLSGTPTTGDEDNIEFSSHALDQLQRLLVFLRHSMYGNLPSETLSVLSNDEYESNKDKAKKQWLSRVKTPFLDKMRLGRAELLRVLSECLVMHRKEDLKLPKPVFGQAEVDVPVPEPVQQRMREDPDSAITILDEYLHTNEYQLLVDEAQGEFILQTLRKAQDDLKARGGAQRAAAAGVIADYEHMDLSVDVRPIKAVVYSHKRNDLISVTEYFLKRLPKENIAELHDPKALNVMGAEMSRFRNDFKEIRVCPICKRENDITLFKEGTTHRCLETLLEVVEETTSGRPKRFLIEPERIKMPVSILEGGNVHSARMGGESSTNYWKNQRFWEAGDLLEVDIRREHPVLPKRRGHAKWAEHGIDKCLELAREDYYQGHDWYFGELPRAEQERNTMVVRLAKWQPCWRFHNPSRWYKGPRLSDAPIQRIDEDVFLLALDAELSHGLDLSFVTHMFLLEPIEDAALLEQVTSRAHRLGAKGAVKVETVNVFYKLDTTTEERMEQVTVIKGQASVKDALLDERKKALTKECCQYCFRAFDSKALAEHHEKTNCPRNPDIKSTVDPFHLSSVYREIKPPPAVHARALMAELRHNNMLA